MNKPNFILQLTLQAKKAAEDASKHALEASKQAAGVSKNTLEDLTYVGKSTLGDLTKTAKEAAAKKGLMKTENPPHPSHPSHPTHIPQQIPQHHYQPHMQTGQGNTTGTSLVSHGASGLIAGTGRDFLSSFSSELNGITSSTSSMFSGLFGKSMSILKKTLQSLILNARKI